MTGAVVAGPGVLRMRFPPFEENGSRVSCAPAPTSSRGAQNLENRRPSPENRIGLRTVLLHHAFETALARSPEAVALTFEGQRHTYAELGVLAERLAAALQARGLARGDRVTAFLPNRMEAVVVLLATLRAGGVFHPVGALTKERKLHNLLLDARPTCLVADAALASEWSGPAAAARTAGLDTVVVVGHDGGGEAAGLPFSDLVSPGAGRWREPGTIDQDLAVLLYTSGSTGEPKGVMLTHLNLVSATRSIQAYLGLEADDVLLGALPLSFGYGLSQLLLAFHAGARVALHRSFAFPGRILESMQEERVTVFAGVPTMFSTVLNLHGLDSFDLESLRVITNAGAAIREGDVARVRARFPRARFFSMYGQTECHRITYLPPEELDRRPRSVGRGMPNQECYLIDSEGARLPNGGTGQLVVRGSHVMRGYWGRPAETAERLKEGGLPGERVLHTGDIFRTDDLGYLYFVSRSDDVVKTGGEKVAPREVEEAVLALAGVREAAVVGVPDERLGEALRAFVVLEQPGRYTERDVVKHCLANLESFMAPRQVRFVAELPRTPNGKIDRLALKAWPD
jgi:amino acid adenylation domain-containing protein